jgi:hypothetical protein
MAGTAGLLLLEEVPGQLDWETTVWLQWLLKVTLRLQRMLDYLEIH